MLGLRLHRGEDHAFATARLGRPPPGLGVDSLPEPTYQVPHLVPG